MKKIYIVILSIILIVFLLVVFSDYRCLFYIQANEDMTSWTIVNDSPGAQKEYPPQGITKVDSNIIISNHQFDKESRVYELNNESAEIIRKFVMPDEAVHTGGLCWDGSFLYAIDYKSNKVYKINYEESFNTGVAKVIDSFDTTFKGSSACAIITDAEIPMMIISDFKNSHKTVIIDLDSSFKDRTIENNILYSYDNESFSQGLCYWNGYIFEVENKVTKSVVNIYDFEALVSGAEFKEVFVNQYYLPDKGGQDIYVDDEVIIISDAVTFKIYKGNLSQLTKKLIHD